MKQVERVQENTRTQAKLLSLRIRRCQLKQVTVSAAHTHQQQDADVYPTGDGKGEQKQLKEKLQESAQRATRSAAAAAAAPVSSQWVCLTKVLLDRGIIDKGIIHTKVFIYCTKVLFGTKSDQYSINRNT